MTSPASPNQTLITVDNLLHMQETQIQNKQSYTIEETPSELAWEGFRCVTGQTKSGKPYREISLRSRKQGNLFICFDQQLNFIPTRLEVSGVMVASAPGEPSHWMSFAGERDPGLWIRAHNSEELIHILAVCRNRKHLVISFQADHPEFKATIEAINALGLVYGFDVSLQVHGTEEQVKTNVQWLYEVTAGYQGPCDVQDIKELLHDPDYTVNYQGVSSKEILKRAKNQKPHLEIRFAEGAGWLRHYKITFQATQEKAALQIEGVEFDNDGEIHIEITDYRDPQLRAQAWLYTSRPGAEWIAQTNPWSNVVFKEDYYDDEQAEERKEATKVIKKHEHLLLRLLGKDQKTTDLIQLSHHEAEIEIDQAVLDTPHLHERQGDPSLIWSNVSWIRFQGGSHITAIKTRETGLLRIALTPHGMPPSDELQESNAWLFNSQPELISSGSWEKRSSPRRGNAESCLSFATSQELLWAIEKMSKASEIELLIDAQLQEEGIQLIRQLAAAVPLLTHNFTVRSNAEQIGNRIDKALKNFHLGFEVSETELIKKAVANGNLDLWTSNGIGELEFVKLLKKEIKIRASVRINRDPESLWSLMIQGTLQEGAEEAESTMEFTLAKFDTDCYEDYGYNWLDDLWINFESEKQLDAPWIHARSMAEAIWLSNRISIITTSARGHDDKIKELANSGEKRIQKVNPSTERKNLHAARLIPPAIKETQGIKITSTSTSFKTTSASPLFSAPVEAKPLIKSEAILMGESWLPGEQACVKLILRGRRNLKVELLEQSAEALSEQLKLTVTPSRMGLIVQLGDGQHVTENALQRSAALAAQATRTLCKLSAHRHSYFEAAPWGGSKEELEKMLHLTKPTHQTQKGQGPEGN